MSLSIEFSYTDPISGLTAECIVDGFPEFNAVEWVLHFRNGSDKKSAQLRAVNVVDLTWKSEAKGDFNLLRLRGSMRFPGRFSTDSQHAVGSGFDLYVSGRRSLIGQQRLPLFQPRNSRPKGRCRRYRMDRDMVCRCTPHGRPRGIADQWHEVHGPFPLTPKSRFGPRASVCCFGKERTC